MGRHNPKCLGPTSEQYSFSRLSEVVVLEEAASGLPTTVEAWQMEGGMLIKLFGTHFNIMTQSHFICHYGHLANLSSQKYCLTHWKSKI